MSSMSIIFVDHFATAHKCRVSFLAMQHRAHAGGPTAQVSGWHSPDKSVLAVLLTLWCQECPSLR